MFGLGKWLRELVFGKWIGSLVRSVIAALGGYLMASGNIDPETVKEFVSALTEITAQGLPVLIAFLMSLFEKYVSRPKEIKKAQEEL